ncbi:MAG TPA: hypothetical protein ENI64_10320 [Gammaproteobacteria bacterium]|nr:hypothetical protein [Gammaproteobacteria bacterium]
MSIDDNPFDKSPIPVLEEVVIPGNPEALATPEPAAELLNLPSTDNINIEAIAPLLEQIAAEIQEDFKHEILDEIIPVISAAVHEQVNRQEAAIQQKLVFKLQEHLPELIQALHDSQKD